MHCSEACGIRDLGEKYVAMSRFGRFGVEIFFIVSAYLAFTSYSKVKDGTIWDKVEWCVKKHLKLLPLIWLLLFKAKAHGWRALAVAFCLHGINPYWLNSQFSIEWYLGVLVFLYPSMLILYPKIKSLRESLINFGGVVIFYYWIVPFIKQGSLIKDTDLWIYYVGIIASAALALSVGIVLYFLLPMIPKDKVLGYISLGLCISLLFNIYNSDSNIFFRLIIFSLLIISLHMQPTVVIVNPVLSVLGKYSYEIYLLHLSANDYMVYNHMTRYPFFNFFMVLGIALCAGIVIYHLYEKYAIRVLYWVFDKVYFCCMRLVIKRS